MKKTIAVWMACFMIFAWVVTQPTRAQAWWIGCCPAAVTSVATMGTALTAFVEGYIVLTYLTLATSFATLNVQITANSEVMKEAMQFQVMSYTNTKRQSATKKAQIDTGKPPSYAISAVATAITANSDLNGRVIKQNLSDISTQYYRNLIPETSRSDGTNSIALLERRKEFCGVGDEAMGLCKAVAKEKQNLDIDASTIINNDVLDGDKLLGATYLLQNLVGKPAPRPDKQDIRLKSGIEKIKESHTLASRQSVASEVFNYLIAMRSPINDNKIKQWINKLYNSTYNMNSSGTNGTSLYEITRAMSTYRYYTPDWLEKINQEKSDVVIEKEWVLIRSQRLFLDWKRQELKQLVAAALAATNNVDAEKLKNIRDQ